MKVLHLASMVVAAAAFSGCLGRGSSDHNQIEPSTSPSGAYVLTLPIEPQTIDPSLSGEKVWKVTISDSSGRLLYKDDASTMLGYFNVYWGWDSKDRVWLFNSDDGLIWRWEKNAAGWTKSQAKRSDGCPDFVLPDYARKRLSKTVP